MTNWARLLIFMAATSWQYSVFAVEEVGGSANSNLLNVQSLTVAGKTIPLSESVAKVEAFPQNISFVFGAASNASRVPVRLRYKLEGYDTDWRENAGTMSLAVRFYDEAGDQVSQAGFDVMGDSAGWKGGVNNSPLTHRREPIVVPPRASRLWIVITSAGPPSSVGVYVVDDLVVSRPSAASGADVVFRLPFHGLEAGDAPNNAPEGWIRDGTHPSMAKIIDLGQNPTTKAFAIMDDDPNGHAEWHNIKEFAPKVSPGDHLVVEWNEMFSLGLGNTRTATYGSLPPGEFRFRVAEATVMGTLTGAEVSVLISVPPPYWRKPWFWAVAFFVATGVAIVSARSVTRYRMRQEMVRLKHQQALEQERLRIAHDIHDDVGARVTQISLYSAMAKDDPTLPDKARNSFDQISRMSRELVSALYETVWAVNPENDNLDALGNYLCQMVDQLCEQAQLPRRLHVLDLPREIQISSQTRHNISMAVKEAVHNVIKHAKATELTVHVKLEQMLLTISIHDNGCGFQLNKKPAGNGLINMRRRLENIGGSCVVESKPNEGTTVCLRLGLSGSPMKSNSPEKL